ncbi:MAG: DNA-binding protein [Clostridia bacterium]|nr:DNA-binding protein [Clostridia bacterium]
MTDILMSPIRIIELDILIQNSVRKVLTEIIPPLSNSSKDELLTVDKAAELLTVSVPTIYGYVHKKSIPHMKRRGRLYFSREEIISWVRSSRRLTRDEIRMAAAESLKQK